MPNPIKYSTGSETKALKKTSAATARVILVNNHGWTISDYGPL